MNYILHVGSYLVPTPSLFSVNIYMFYIPTLCTIYLESLWEPVNVTHCASEQGVSSVAGANFSLLPPTVNNSFLSGAHQDPEISHHFIQVTVSYCRKHELGHDLLPLSWLPLNQRFSICGSQLRPLGVEQPFHGGGVGTWQLACISNVGNTNEGITKEFYGWGVSTAWGSVLKSCSIKGWEPLLYKILFAVINSRSSVMAGIWADEEKDKDIKYEH